jgi:hypothetical protein
MKPVRWKTVPVVVAEAAVDTAVVAEAATVVVAEAAATVAVEAEVAAATVVVAEAVDTATVTAAVTRTVVPVRTTAKSPVDFFQRNGPESFRAVFFFAAKKSEG